LGIFAVAALTRLPDKHVHVLVDPIGGMPRGRSAPISKRQFTVHRSKKGCLMKKKNRIETERKIVSSVKREMNQPRLTESVRNGFSVQAAPAVEKPAARSARA
jgi:hypothetical protein